MANSPFTLLGFPNYVVSGLASVGAFNLSAPIPAGFEASYLRTEEPSDTARISSVIPTYTAWTCIINSATVLTIDGLCLVNSNISPNGYYRFNGPAQAPVYNVLIPASVVSSSNLAGAVTNIDESIISMDGLFIGPSTTSADWNVLLSFGTPADNPITGTARAHFTVACQMFGAPLITYPRLIVELWKSGVKVASLGWRAANATTSATGIYIFPFDPTLLAAPSGAGTQIKIFGEYGDSGSYFKVDCVNLFFESSQTVSANDSGWLLSPTGYFNSSNNSRPPQTNLQYFPANAWLVSGNISISALVMDDQVDHNPDIGFGNHGVPFTSVSLAPSGYTQAGVFIAGIALSQQISVIRPGNPAVGVTTEGIAGTTLGGQTFGADLWRRRTISPMSMVVTRDEGFTIMNSVMWLKGNSGAFYLSFDRTLSAKYQIFSGAWVTVRDTSTCVMQPLQPVQYTTDGSMLHLLTFPQCDEKL